MSRLSRFLIIACVCAGCSGGRLTVCPDSPSGGAYLPAASAAAHAEDEQTAPVDDRRQMQRLAAEAARLKEAGRTVKMASLIEQLKSPQCRLDLPAAPKQTIAAEVLYERTKDSVLVVAAPYKCEKCGKTHVSTATAFVASASGACVTNYHVVDEPKRDTLVVMTADGRVLPVKAVLAASKADDAAVLQVDGLVARPLALAAGARVGLAVRVISHPDARFYTLTKGIVSRYLTFRRAGADVPMMAITADYARGSSGGPVLNDCGAVVGMVANTHSIHYEEKDGRQGALQMVVKQCVPAAAILKLIRPE